MLSATLFKFGPYNICFWNLLFFVIIIVVSMLLRRVIHKMLRRSLRNANIRVEGRMVTWLKVLSQSIYLLAFYIAVLSLRINNSDVSFMDFLDFKIIDLEKFDLSFYHILVILLIYFAARMSVNLVKLYITRKFRDKNEFNEGIEFIYIQIAKYVIYVMAIIASLKALDVNLTILITSSVGLFVGLGLGLQDVFKDMIAGIVLLIEGNIRVGDVVEINSGSKSESIVAKILKINVRTTHIETRDGNVLIIPNTKITQDNVENWTHGSKLTRFRIPVTVAYGSDTELVVRILKQAALSHPKVKKTEPVLVRLSDFGENGLYMELIFWADQSWDIQNYKSEIRFEIDRLFREYKVTIPFPQRDIRIHQKDTTLERPADQ
jgi:small-conductance mechanosensitive channel